MSDEKRVLELFDILSNEKDIILFVDEIHSFVGTGRSLSGNSLDIANIIKPFITSDNIHLVGATTDYEYDEFIQSDPAFSRRFSNIQVEEPNDETLEKILEYTIQKYSKQFNVKVDKKMVNRIAYALVNATRKTKRNYDKLVYNPDLAISIIAKAFGYARLYNNKSISEREFIKAYETSDKVVGELNIIAYKKSQNKSKIIKFDFNKI